MKKLKEIKTKKSIDQLGNELLDVLLNESFLVSFQALKKAELELMAEWMDEAYK